MVLRPVVMVDRLERSYDHIVETDLRRYLQEGRDAILWKLEGLPEYDAHRPLTPTGTNLLGPRTCGSKPCPRKWYHSMVGRVVRGQITSLMDRSW